METDSRPLIRQASPTDVKGLVELRWNWRHEEQGEDGDRVEFEHTFANWLRNEAASHTAFVAELDARLIGMAWLAVVPRVPSPGRPRRLAGHLQSVYVVPEWRNRDIGKELVDSVIDHARSLGLDYLVVHPTERAFSLYRRAGFAETPRLLELDLGSP